MIPEPPITNHLCTCQTCSRAFISRRQEAPYCAVCLLARVVVTTSLSYEDWCGGSAFPMTLPDTYGDSPRFGMSGWEAARLTGEEAAILTGADVQGSGPAAAYRASVHYQAVQQETDAWIADREMARRGRTGGLSGPGIAALGVVATAALAWVLMVAALSAWRGY